MVSVSINFFPVMRTISASGIASLSSDCNTWLYIWVYSFCAWYNFRRKMEMFLVNLVAFFLYDSTHNQTVTYSIISCTIIGKHINTLIYTRGLILIQLLSLIQIKVMELPFRATLAIVQWKLLNGSITIINFIALASYIVLISGLIPSFFLPFSFCYFCYKTYSFYFPLVIFIVSLHLNSNFIF